MRIYLHCFGYVVREFPVATLCEGHAGTCQEEFEIITLLIGSERTNYCASVCEYYLQFFVRESTNQSLTIILGIGAQLLQNGMCFVSNCATRLASTAVPRLTVNTPCGFSCVGNPVLTKCLIDQAK